MTTNVHQRQALEPITDRGLAPSAMTMKVAVEDTDAAITAILKLLAEALDVGLVFLSRVTTSSMHVERVHTRSAMNMREGQVVPLVDTYCRVMLEGAMPSMVVADARAAPYFSKLAATSAMGIGAYAGVPLHSEDGRIYGTLCTLHPQPRATSEAELLAMGLAGSLIMRSVDARDQQRREIYASQDLDAAREVRSFYKHMGCGVCVMAGDGRIIESNDAAAHILGLPAANIRGKTPWELFIDVTTEDGARMPGLEHPLLDVLRRQQPVRDLVLRVTRPDGLRRWLQMDAVPVVDGASIVHVVLSFIDVTQRRLAEDSLRHLALHDALTGLPNRTLLLEQARSMLLVAQREGHDVHLVRIDVRNARAVTDAFGQECGDELLRQVASRLVSAAGPAGIVAHLGGGALVLLAAQADGEGSRAWEIDILAALNVEYLVHGYTFHADTHAGASMFPRDGQDASDLLRRADIALVDAKRLGNELVFYHPGQDERIGARLSLSADLRKAIQDNQLALHYQPKVCLATGRLRGVEALLRWRHPHLGMVPPDEFIPVAEQTGLILPLTDWVLETAIRQIAAWSLAGTPVQVAVNLSMASLYDPNLIRAIGDLLRRHQAPVNLLRLELTESSVMADVQQAMQTLRQLHDLGIALSVDDFGTGYSSLAYLRRFPLDELTIDKAFIQHMTADEADAAIVFSIIKLGHELGLHIVAEGIEDEQTIALLTQAGCDVAQGYHFSRPVEAANLANWLDTLSDEAHNP